MILLHGIEKKPEYAEAALKLARKRMREVKHVSKR